jgi:hypothetical protein
MDLVVESGRAESMVQVAFLFIGGCRRREMPVLEIVVDFYPRLKPTIKPRIGPPDVTHRQTSLRVYLITQDVSASGFAYASVDFSFC